MAVGAEWIRVAAVDDVFEGACSSVQVNDVYIALHRLEGGDIHATSDVCTHEFARLSDGWLDGSVIVCPLHGGRFDVCTGRPAGGPVHEGISVFETRLCGSEVWVRVDPKTGKPRQKNDD